MNDNAVSKFDHMCLASGSIDNADKNCFAASGYIFIAINEIPKFALALT